MWGRAHRMACAAISGVTAARLELGGVPATRSEEGVTLYIFDYNLREDRPLPQFLARLFFLTVVNLTELFLRV